MSRTQRALAWAIAVLLLAALALLSIDQAARARKHADSRGSEFESELQRNGVRR